MRKTAILGILAVLALAASAQAAATNVDFFTNASQLTTNGTAVAVAAVDENLGVSSTTNGNAVNWWKTDLGAAYTIDSINVVGQNADYGPGRINGRTLSVYASADASGTALWSTVISGVTASTGVTYVLPSGISGRSVKIENNSSDPNQTYLQIAEIYTYANNLARDGVASQSGTNGVYVAANAIDSHRGNNVTYSPPTLNSPYDGSGGYGDTKGAWTTNPGAAGAWWQVDLGAVNQIDVVKLWNTTSVTVKDLFSDLDIQVLSASGAVVYDYYTAHGNTYFNPGNTLLGPSSYLLDLNGLGVNGKYVKVTREGNTGGDYSLYLKEVEVYGSAIPEPGALVLLTLGGIGMLLKRRRRA